VKGITFYLVFSNNKWAFVLAYAKDFRFSTTSQNKLKETLRDRNEKMDRETVLRSRHLERFHQRQHQHQQYLSSTSTPSSINSCSGSHGSTQENEDA
jgi:peptide methionine sulfoxide reductase MsrA